MDLCDHLTHEPQGIRNDEHFLFDVHHDHFLGELDEELDGLRDVLELEEVLLLLQVEEDLADYDSERKVEDLVVELFHLELEIACEDSL